MPPKRASPLDEPPTASSSEEEEEVSSEEEGGSSSSEEEDEEPAQPAKPPLNLQSTAIEKKSTPKKLPTSITPQPQPSSSESDSDSGSETEDDQPTAAVGVKVKPIASKPMEEAPKKNSKAQPAATPPRSGMKRPSENSRPGNGVKRAKGADTVSSKEVVAAEDGGKKKSDSKKLFQRLWSEDDEIAILNGMNEYRLKNGVDPYKNMDAFHDFIKGSLHVDVSRNQLMDKIRSLKKKYEKTATKAENGKDPSFTKLHYKKVFELSKKVWVSEGTTKGVEQDKDNGKGRNIKKGTSSRNVASPQAQLTSSPNSKSVEKIHGDQSSGSILSVNQMIKLSGLSEDVIRRGLESVEASKKAELEERWKNLQLLELELFVKRAELIRDQSKLILEAHKSSNH